MLEIQKLHASYGNDVILNGIDLSVKTGNSLAIIGESGAGKTTLGRCIMRLSEARTEGSILFDGSNLLAASEDEMQAIRWNRISMVFQNVDSVLNPVYTALDQAAEPMTEHKLYSKEQARERARELMSLFGLPERRFHAYPHELSGGEQQRVLLAMAFANNPDLVIMDEPLSSLDVTARHELAGILEKDGGQCARLVITHDLDTARRLAENIAVLYGGRIVESGSSAEVLAHPRHPYTRALLRAYPNMTTVKDLQGIRGRMNRPFGPGCPFQPRCTQSIECCKTEPPLLNGDGRKVACHRGGIVTRLAIHGLTVRYGNFTAVDDLNIDIMAGETVALVGESGSGKTTLAKAVIGLQPPQSGEIFLEGRKIKDNDLDFHRRVQMVFQNPGDSLSHRLSVLELVMEPLDVQKICTKEERREKAVQAIREAELPVKDGFLDTYPHHLSGGELQRVAIARALVTGPDLLIADEPTAFLDAGVGAKILKLLLNLQEQHGLSLIFITHDIAAARKVSDRIAVMAQGKIVESGPAAQVTTSPRSPVTRALLDAAGRLE